MKYILFSLLIKFVCLILPIFLSVAFLTLFERKVMASMQRRRGPNIVGLFGLLQPFADALKLLMKETILPNSSNILIFFISPLITLILSLLCWSIIPFYDGILLVDININVLLIQVISSLIVYSMVMAGWSSNSKYSFLGSLRATAQMISYEISISLIITSIFLCVGSLNFFSIVNAQKEIFFFWAFTPLFFMFLISVLAETNRPPFDLPEAEGELVAGYFVEYSAVGFAFFFIAETLNIIFMCFLISFFFFGGWLSPFSQNFCSFYWLPVKIIFFCFLFIWIRASLPRYRYDQLMFLGWKIFLPLSVSFVFLISILLFFFNGFYTNYLW